MKQFIKKNLKLMFSAVLGVMLFAFAFVGVNNVKKVSAEEITVDSTDVLLYEYQKLPDEAYSNGSWQLAEFNGTETSNYYAYTAEDLICFTLGSYPFRQSSDWLIGSISSFQFSIPTEIATLTINGNDGSYYVFYIPEKFDNTYIHEDEIFGMERIYWDNVNLSGALSFNDNSHIDVYTYVPSDEPETPEEPETPDEPETPEEPEVEVITMYDTMFFLPDMYDKSNWVESEITATSAYKDSYGGKWFRWKKPETSESKHAFNLQMTINGELKTQGLTFDLEKEKITFGRYSVEYQLKEYHGELYLEFYLPEIFDKTVCYASNLSTKYHDYFDNTYLISYKNSKADIVFIDAPDEPETPEEPEMGGVSGGAWDEFDGDAEEDLSFIQKTGKFVSGWFNVSNPDYNLWGVISLITGGIIVIAVLGLIFKLK